MSDSIVIVPDFKLTLGEQDLSEEPLSNRVMEIDVDQVSDGPASFKVVLDDYDNAFSDGEKAIHEGDSCVIQLGYSGSEVKKLLEGIVTGCKIRRLDNGRPLFIVTGMDGLQALARGHKRRSWEQIKDSDIASQIANECGLQADVDDSKTVVPYVVQNDMTNLKFLLGRAKRIGYELKVEEKRLVFKKPDYSKDPIVLRYNAGKAEKDTVLLMRCNFHTSTKGVVSQVTVRGYDVKEGKPIIATAKDVSDSSLSQNSGTDAAGKNNPDTSIQISCAVETQEEADNLAQSILDERAAGYMTGEGRCQGNAGIVPGCKVKVMDIGKDYEGEYYVKEATHSFRAGGRNHGYWTKFRVAKSGR